MENLSEYTDEELALSYSEGNNRAFDELLARNQDRLFSYILFVVHDEDRANDLFQETFVKVITKLQEHSYTNCGKFAAWIMRIAHNVIMDWYRDEKDRNIMPNPDGKDITELCGASVLDSNIENKFVKEQVLTDVRRMVEHLPPTQREVVFMRYYQNMPFKEIALTTGVSINTSLGRLRYALINMRKMSKDYSIALQLN